MMVQDLTSALLMKDPYLSISIASTSTLLVGSMSMITVTTTPALVAVEEVMEA